MGTSWENIHKAKILGRPIQPKNLASEILNKRISPHTQAYLRYSILQADKRYRDTKAYLGTL